MKYNIHIYLFDKNLIAIPRPEPFISIFNMERRIYVGNLFQNVDECVTQLYGRFQKFGQCLNKEFEQHDTFAYINMSFENEAQLNNLKRCFNNVKFKGNELRVAEAKPDWNALRVARQEQDEKESCVIEKKMQKKNWEYFKKIENINMDWENRCALIPGRVRETPRPKKQVRNPTFRINVNGSLKVYKCYKTKLWGFERDKDVRDLVIKFSNNQWRNDYDHIVDRLTYQRSKIPVRYASIIQNHQDFPDDHHSAVDEKEKINNVLDNILNTFNFEKPLELEEDEEITVKKHADMDVSTHQSKLQDGGDSHGYTPTQQKVSFSETSKTNLPSHHEDILSNSGSVDNKFIPNFSSTKDVKGENTGNTETLRDLFNPEDARKDGFKLIAESDDDIDHQKDSEVDAVTIAPQELWELNKVEPQTLKKDIAQLFFPHFNSPFLVGQTQLTRVKSVYNETNFEKWDDEFWDNRGPWMKEAKRRKRDVLRQLKKNSSKTGNGPLL